MSTRHQLVLPELGAGNLPISLSLWLVEVGQSVTEGDRLVEVIFGSVCVDLPSPATGTLVETCVAEDDPLQVGQVLGVVESD